MQTNRHFNKPGGRHNSPLTLIIIGASAFGICANEL